MKKEDFLQQVKEEIIQLKERATQEEISRLDWLTFNSTKTNGCFLGQMTGHCLSERSKQLISKTYLDINERNPDHNSAERLLNQIPYSTQTYRKGNYYTALEKACYFFSLNEIFMIFEYLKGSKESIDFI